MQNTLELTDRDDRNKQILTAQDVQRLIEQSRGQPVEGFWPINIQINLGNERGLRWSDGNQYGFRFHRSKLLWVAMLLLLSVGVTYARTRVMCQSFKDQGRFYYGMDVGRCVEVLIRQPLATVEGHLAQLDKSY